MTCRPGVLQAIGDTPLVEIDGIFAKLEHLNPSGSVKARIAVWMVEEAERLGQLRSADVIMEASSGNTGNALAMVAAAKGYRMVVVMPSGLSPERAAISRAYGAEIRTVGDFHVDEALEYVRSFRDRLGYWIPDQFSARENVAENRRWLGTELLADLDRRGVRADAVVAGVGTGGTLVGVGQAVRQRWPGVRLVAVEPEESPTMSSGGIARHRIEGIADGFVPDIIRRHRDEIDSIALVSSGDAIAAAQQLARRHGLFVGPSSGANLVAATRVREELGPGTAVITIFSDAGEKYLASDDISAGTDHQDSSITDNRSHTD